MKPTTPEKKNNKGQIFYICMKTQEERKDLQYLDSDCINHMMGNQESFVKLEENANSQVKLGDGRTQSLEGKGVIAINTKRVSPSLFMMFFMHPI